MRLVKIPKKTKGEFREICIPSAEEKNVFRGLVSELNSKALKLCDDSVVHGFQLRKSPVTNAQAHVGYAYTLKFDLSNFFDTVKPSHLKGKITEEQIKIVMPDNRAYQGLPTSPVVANIAAVDMDTAILRKIKDKKIVYTRYADDMCFSFNDYENVSFLKTAIPQIVGRCGFKLNKSKTWLQDARYGKRMITGVSVDANGISSSRKVRRKLRAAIHQGNKNSAMGLTEWSKLKTPCSEEEQKNRITKDQLYALCKIWNIRRINPQDIPKKETIILDNNVVISGDPIQMLGLSNWTTNWRSCMHHPNGAYHRHAALWVYSKGTSIAGLLSGQTSTVAGFTRPTFKARALVHTMEDGRKYFDRVYGESYTAQNALIAELTKNGITELSRRRIGVLKRVIGMIPCSKCSGTPYMDTLSYDIIKKDDVRYYKLLA